MADQHVGEPLRGLCAEQRGVRVAEPVDLRLHGRDDMRVAVAEAGDGRAARAVDDLMPGGIAEPDPAAGHGDRRRLAEVAVDDVGHGRGSSGARCCRAFRRSQHPPPRAGHATGDGARHQRRQAEGHDVLPPLRTHGRHAAHHDPDRAEVGEAAQRIGQDEPGAFRQPRPARACKVEVGDELVDDHLHAERGADRRRLARRHAHRPGHGPQHPSPSAPGA